MDGSIDLQLALIDDRSISFSEELGRAGGARRLQVNIVNVDDPRRPSGLKRRYPNEER